MNYAHVDLLITPGSIVWLGLLALFLSGLLPGFILSCWLCRSKNQRSIYTATPMFGMVIVYVAVGSIFSAGLYSNWLAITIILALNISAAVPLRDQLQSLSVKRDVQNKTFNFDTLMFIVFLIACFSVLTPIFMFEIPYGVDWIGFSNLSAIISSNSSLNFSNPNLGNWLYPPAFLSVCSFYSSSLGIPEFKMAQTLGYYSLFCILLGLYSLFEREKFGNVGGILSFLGIGLFTKTFDSGWPTISSFLPLVMGIIIIIESEFEFEKLNWSLAIVALLSALLLHPTGFVSLLLLLALYLTFLSVKYPKESKTKPVFSASIVCIVVLYFLSRSVDQSVVFSEYGWQGGSVLLSYNFPIIFISVFFAFTKHRDEKVKFFSIWFLLLWVLTLVNLMTGLSDLPVIRLLSYVFYSMGIHSFQIPLILIAGYGGICLRDSMQTEVQIINFDSNLKKIVLSLYFILLLLIPSGIYIVADVSKNDHHLATTESMFELIDEVNSMELESVVFTENSHWGFIVTESVNFETTSLPNLGLMNREYTIQDIATEAIKSNDYETLNSLQIEYAISSPLGSLQWLLSSVGTWDVVLDYDGSRLWRLNPNGSETDIQILSDSGICDAGTCENVEGLWTDFRFLDPYGLGVERTKMIGESQMNIDLSPHNGIDILCIMYEIRGRVNSFQLISVNEEVLLNSSNGWHLGCSTIPSDGFTDVVLQVEANNPGSFFNPSYLSGRSEKLFEESGVVIHHIELHSQSQIGENN